MEEFPSISAYNAAYKEAAFPADPLDISGVYMDGWEDGAGQEWWLDFLPGGVNVGENDRIGNLVARHGYAGNPPVQVWAVNVTLGQVKAVRLQDPPPRTVEAFISALHP